MSSGHTILLVEDEPAVATATRQKLEAAGYHVVTAATKEEAIAKVDGGLSLCGVVADIEIPAQPKTLPFPEAGFDMIVEIRKRQPGRNPDTPKNCHRTPIVVHSGHAAEHDDVMRAMQAGADDFCPKSADRTRRTLSTVLASALARSGREQHAHCNAMNREAAIAPAALRKRLNTLSLAVRADGKRLVVEIDDKPLALRKKPFSLLLRLVLAQLSSADDGWVSRTDLGAPDDLDGWDGIRRLNEDLKASRVKHQLVYDKTKPKHLRLPLTTSIAVPIDVGRIRKLLGKGDDELHELLDELERIQSRR